MFLNENTKAAEDHIPELAADTSVDYLGEDFELLDIVTEANDELHNLTYSMMRLEHKAVVTENTALLEAGVESYFKNALKKIKAFWSRFKAWVMKAVDTVVNKIFGPRKKWLDENKSKLLNKSDFGGKKVKLAETMLRVEVGGSVGQAEKVIGQVAQQVGKIASKAQIEEMQEDAVKNFGGNPGKDSISQAVTKTYLGEKTEEVALTDAIVKKLVGVAETTFDNAPKMKALSKIADLAVKTAEQNVTVKSDAADKRAEEKAQLSLRAVQVMGNIATQTVTAIKSVNEKLNSQAMSALTTALHAGPKQVNASTEADNAEDVLARFA